MPTLARLLTLLALLATVNVAVAAEEKTPDEINKADLEKLTGAWKVIKLEAGGEEIPADFLSAIVLTIDGDKYQVEGIPEGTQKGNLKIDATKDMKEMTIEPKEGPNADKPAKAIYKFDEEKVIICYDLTGEAFPKDFKSTAENKVIVITYERKKKEETKKE